MVLGGSDKKTSLEQELMRGREGTGLPVSRTAQLEQKMVDRKDIEADLAAQQTARNLTTSMAAGELPANSDIVNVLERAEKTTRVVMADPTLSADARGAAADVSNIVTGLKQTVLEKNPDEALQKVVHHSREAAIHAKYAAPGSGVATAQAELRNSISSVYDLSRLLVTSSEFRGLMLELGRTLNQIVQNRIQQQQQGPSSMGQQSMMGQQSTLGQQSTFGQQSTLGQTSLGQPSFGQSSFGQSSLGQQSTFGQTSLGQQQEPWLKGKSKAPWEEEQERMSLQQSSGMATFDQAADSAKQTSARMAEQNPILQPLHQQVTAAAEDAKGKARVLYDSLNDEQVQNRIISILQKWLARINAREDFRRGIRDIIMSMRGFYDNVGQTEQYLDSDPEAMQFRIHAAKARHEAKKLLERFSSSHAISQISNNLRLMAEGVRADRDLDNYLVKLRVFVLRCVDDLEFVKGEEFKKELRSLLSDSQGVFQRYREQYGDFFNEITGYLQDFTGDQTLSSITNSTRSLLSRLFLGDDGNLSVKPQTLMDLRKVLGPLIREELKYIYIPRLSGDDENMTWMMENIMLRGEDVMPDKIVVENYNKAVLLPNAPATQSSGGASAVIRVYLTGIRAHVPDVHMAYKRKTFPKMEDVITFDAHLAGEGLSIEILLSAANIGSRLFNVNAVNTDVDDFTLKNIHGVDHSDVMYTMLKPIIASQARRNMETSIAEAVRERLEDLNSLLLEYKDRIAPF